MAAAIIIALPYGVPMVFSPDPMNHVIEYHSYFSVMPIGYGNWFLIITARLSVIILVLLIIRIAGLATKRDVTGKLALICLLICIGAQLLSWLIFRGGYRISIIGVIVFVLHVAMLALQIKYNKLYPASLPKRA